MQRVILSIVLLVSCYTSSSMAADWSLITEEEFRSERGAPHGERSLAKILPGAPSIEVEQPDESRPIKSPVTIKLHFHAADEAVINLRSIRITYGWLGIDITSRVLEHAELTKDGLTATNATLPSGEHSVTMQIADSKGRVATKTFDFTVI